MNEDNFNVSLDALLDAGDAAEAESNRALLAGSAEGRRWLALAGALGELPQPVPAPDLAPRVLTQVAAGRPATAPGASAAAAGPRPGAWARLSGWLGAQGIPAGPALGLAGALAVVAILAMVTGDVMGSGTLSGWAAGSLDGGWPWLLGAGLALVAGLAWWWSRRR